MVGRRVTAEDVAKLAGVSRATVSYVLNNHPHQTIPEATRARVIDAATALEYTPLASARILSRGRSDVVVMLIPDWPLGSVIPTIMDTVAERLAPHGLEVFLHRCREGRPVRDLWNAITPAAVIRTGSLGIEEDESLRRSQIGFLLELANSEFEPGLVLFPGVQTGRLQAEHLAARGHRRIGYAWPSDPRLETFARARLDGVRQACLDLDLDQPQVENSSFEADEIGRAVHAWTAAGVTGICAFNDELAIGLIQTALAAGHKVPDDLGVVGVDNLPWGALSNPALTTVTPHPDRIGEVVAEHVLAGLEGRTSTERVSSDSLSLIVRASA